MSGLSCRVMEHAERLPEATPLCPEAMDHLGNSNTVDQELQRLAQSGRLMRICEGVYMRPIETRFGLRAPRLSKVLTALAALWSETIVPCGGAVANCLGLTTQNPVRDVYLTSGPNRRLHFGSSVVELGHAPSWQLVAPHRKAGDVVRALEWLGPEEVEYGLKAVLPTLSDVDREELAALQATSTMPRWMAEPISARLVHG
ncbi:MAG: hypothetical protein F4Z75_05840 [Synechococcus sp. SB0668_bin_15]|nr:hypothetical protein [Synechococcus sp. SB0668_bin_15]MXZ83660.1 hypothetical protein [Synechococcus sp. SB0666_bin_14]MYC49315.1 hypothetical protein [Synechococcus sp. SB0662_bin_14]MYG46958.1 hypothetical protein [Synechococcus sp. SB0675_bin_6]MYJ60090.1 hypothetical protein [Synechococcus sp. SB0672_bin_6]